MAHLLPRSIAIAAMGVENAYDEPQESALDLLLELQSKDPLALSQRRLLAEGIPPQNRSGTEFWSIDDKNLLRHKNAIYVPNDPALKDEIMKRNHDDPHAGHFGTRRTLELIQRKYFWPSMSREVEGYVRTCDICQRTQTPRHKPYGEMQPLPKPTRPWSDITMDFIVGLPPSSTSPGTAYDSILTVVDRYTKMAKYIPVKKTIDAPQLAEVFISNIVRNFGTPDSIVTDRGSVFKSNFWSSLCYFLKTRRRLSTAFHPQTDGQSERQNQTLEHYLRAYVEYTQDDWAKRPDMAEFAYNNSFNSTIKMTPFQAYAGFNPTLNIDVEVDVRKGEAPAARQRIEALQEIRTNLEDCWKQATEYQTKYYNAKHKPKQYNVGDEVLLSAKNIRTRRPSKKLDHRFLGPFKILELVGNQAYRLELPKT